MRYVDQHVCIPTTRCPQENPARPRTGSIFIVNKDSEEVSWPFNKNEEDDIYANDRHMLCIDTERDNNTNITVLHEVCHIKPRCALCPMEGGEFLLMRRTEVSNSMFTGDYIFWPCEWCTYIFLLWV